MPIAAILLAAVQWIFREVMVKFLVFVAFLAMILLLWPVIKELATPFVNFASINAALGGLPSGIWYFLSLMRIDIALPLITGAYVTRFIIRRIPGVG